MTVLGYKTKIKQSGIHVWSEILLDIKTNKGIKSIIIKIDNTFNSVEFERLKEIEAKWKIDYGNGTQVEWYNKKALAEKELHWVMNIKVCDKAKNRINKKVLAWINGE